MSLLTKTRVYLAGNLESTEDAEGWRKEITTKLLNLGILVIDPTNQFLTEQVTENEKDRLLLKKWREEGKFNLIKSFIKDVIRRDLRAIDYVDFLIVKIEPDKPSYGTIHELVIALQQRKPIFVIINDRKKFPLWLIGLLNMDLVFENQDDLIKYLTELNSGKEKMDTKYWKLFIPELR